MPTPKRDRVGRPSKLTKAVTDKVCAALREGQTYQVACTLAGIDYTTFRKWLLRAEERKEPKYVAFLNAVTRAEREAEAEAVRKWRSAFDEDWRAVAEFLARRNKGDWTKETTHKVDQTVRTVDAEDAKEKLAEAVKRKRGGK